jgi:hypothetical protein
MTTTTTHFEDRLLEQLREYVAEQPAPAPAAAVQRAPRRTRLVMAGAGVAAATAAVAIIATSSDVTPSAYAVQPRSDGSVSVKIRSLSDAAGLQRSLREAGVPAVVSYVPATQMACAGPGAGDGVTPSQAPDAGASSSGAAAVAHRSRRASGGAAAQPSHGQRDAIGTETGAAGPSVSGPGPADGADPSVVTSTWTVDSDGATFTIDPGDLKPGENVYITTSTGTVSSIGMSFGTHAPSADCPPPAAP